MRQVFASPRLENVESVAKMLNAAGIDTWVSGGRSYKGNRRSRFSYREHAQEPSGVWIVNANDLSRATELLREHGLMQSTRDRDFVPRAGHSASTPGAPGRSTAMRVRLLLVLVLLGLAAATGWRMLQAG